MRSASLALGNRLASDVPVPLRFTNTFAVAGSSASNYIRGATRFAVPNLRANDTPGGLPVPRPLSGLVEIWTFALPNPEAGSTYHPLRGCRVLHDH